jgi:hypothetical protein
MYEIRDIPSNSRHATSTSGNPYTVGIFDHDRCIFRFRPLASGTSFAEKCLNRLQHPRLDTPKEDT